MMDELEMRVLPGEGGGFTTVGGLMLANLGRVPGPGEHFVAGDWRFEVLDMDGNRVDKVLASKIAT
jgi:putative hemolysin